MPITFWAKVLGETFWANFGRTVLGSFFLEPHFESGGGCWAGLGWVEGFDRNVLTELWGWLGWGWAGAGLWGGRHKGWAGPGWGLGRGWLGLRLGLGLGLGLGWGWAGDLWLGWWQS